ncbi:MAG: c-type cytochrome biogenesis protein CcmI [Pontibacterium sp.]
MTALWLGIAGLTILAAIFVLLPVWRAIKQKNAAVEDTADRKQLNIAIFRERLAELEAERESGSLAESEFDQLKVELEKSLLLDAQASTEEVEIGTVTTPQVMTAALLACIVVVSGLGLYNHFGRAADLELALNQAPHAPLKQPETIEEALDMLKMELANNPNDAEGWYLLASTYINAQRFDEGVEAFSKVLALLPEDAPQYAGVLGQYAQAKYFANGNQMNDDIRGLIDRTLAADPYEISAIGLKGIEAFEAGEYQAAIDQWTKGLVNADGGAADSLRAGINEARKRLESTGAQVVTENSERQKEAEPADVNKAEIKVLVTVADELITRLEPDQALFVFARPIGARMPLAAERLSVNDMPAVITLNDTKAMSPQMVLSQFDTVEVTARISLTGQAIPTKGDMFGTVKPVNTRGNNHVIQLVIDQMVD